MLPLRTIATIEGCLIAERPDLSVIYTARGRVDDDGSGSAHGDPGQERTTSLLVDGRPLNADTDRYIVVPPQIVRGVGGIVLGCQAYVTHYGVTRAAVVGDVGPRDRLGEMSIAMCIALGIDPNPNTGGEDRPIIQYRLLPGVAARVNGVAYPLQHSVS